MNRSLENRSMDAEILDGADIPEDIIVRAHQDLDRLHGLLGNTAAFIAAIRNDPLPVRHILDVGCGHGGLLLQLHRKLGLDVVGVDLRPPAASTVPFQILRADAVKDSLPEADVAICNWLAHHLSEDEFISLIRNVGRSCRRFIILDLVRNGLPLLLFRTFIAPFLSPVNAADGCTSIRRAFTPDEMRAIVGRALAGTSATFRYSRPLFCSRQIVDIRYRGSKPDEIM
jgi:2-polyprenyl-3-methyl-5-hydroxy-6-metoxy-1,4-benzoquinol methylase